MEEDHLGVMDELIQAFERHNVCPISLILARAPFISTRSLKPNFDFLFL